MMLIKNALSEFLYQVPQGRISEQVYRYAQRATLLSLGMEKGISWFNGSINTKNYSISNPFKSLAVTEHENLS